MRLLDLLFVPLNMALSLWDRVTGVEARWEEWERRARWTDGSDFSDRP